MLGWIQKPAVSVVLLGGVWADAWVVGDRSSLANAVSGRGIAWKYVLSRFNRGRGGCVLPNTSAGLCLNRVNGKLVVDELGIGDVTVWMNTLGREEGIWATTSRSCDTTVFLRDQDYTFFTAGPEYEVASAMLLADMAKHEETRELVELLRARGQGPVTLPVPLGYVHNGVEFAGLTGLVLSLGWVPRAWVRRRGERRVRRGECAGCGYDLRGLGDEVCPECGAAPTR